MSCSPEVARSKKVHEKLWRDVTFRPWTSIGFHHCKSFNFLTTFFFSSSMGKKVEFLVFSFFKKSTNFVSKHLVSWNNTESWHTLDLFKLPNAWNNCSKTTLFPQWWLNGDVHPLESGSILLGDNFATLNKKWCESLNCIEFHPS